jgi:hypothetical protein
VPSEQVRTTLAHIRGRHRRGGRNLGFQGEVPLVGELRSKIEFPGKARVRRVGAAPRAGQVAVRDNIRKATADVALSAAVGDIGLDEKRRV